MDVLVKGAKKTKKVHIFLTNWGKRVKVKEKLLIKKIFL